MGTATPLSRRPVEILVAADGTGDYATLDAAVTAAPAGATIQIKRGTYPLTATLTLNKANLTLRGEGERATIIQAPLAALTAVTISADDVTLEALQIDGRRASQPGLGGNGLTVDHAARATLSDVYIHDCKQNGVEAFYADDLLFERCRLINHATNGVTWGGAGSLKGIYVIRSARNVIRQCYLSGWSQAVGWWTGITDSTLVDSFLIDNYGFEDDAATIRRSAFEDYSNGVMDHGRNQVLNCVIDGSASHCLELAQGVVGSQYIGNTLKNPGKLNSAPNLPGGFFSVTGGSGGPGETTSDILVADNYCFSDGARADYADVNNAYRVTVRGNRFVGCNHVGTQAALYILGVAPETLIIEGNHFYACSTALRLSPGGHGVIVRGNQISGPGYSGNCILVNGGAGHLIEGNVLQITGSTGQHGILIDPTAGVGIRVLGNRITVPGCPLKIRSGQVCAQGNWLEETVSTGSGPFQLDGAPAAKCVVRDNHLSAPSVGGYVMNGATLNRVTDNFFVGVGTAINVATAGSGNVITPNY